jgi:hypothetical protein
MSDYSLPIPTDIKTELDRHLLRYGDRNEQIQELQRLQVSTPNSIEQELIWNEITTAIETGISAKYIIQAKGGAGKTTLAKKIIAFARSLGHIVLGCASTGLAATNYDGFETAHSLFCYPVIDDEDRDESEPAQCNFDKKPGRRNILDSARIIIWDEFFSNHRYTNY